MDETQFTAVVFSRLERGEEIFKAEVWTPGYCVGPAYCVLATDPTENFQAVLHMVLDWSRRHGKAIAWDYRLAKGSTMKRFISSGSSHVVGPPGAQAGTRAAPKLGGSAVLTKGEASLNNKESAELFDCEKVIREGLETFVEVGQALSKIRDCRLYRYGFETFEDYVRERWGMSVRHAHRLVDSAEISRNLLPEESETPISPPPVPGAGHATGATPAVTDSTVGAGTGRGGSAPAGLGVTNWSQSSTPPLPTNESQLRPLKGLEPQQQREVWAEANEMAPAGRVTARHVEEARERLHPKPKCDHKFIDSESCLKCGWTPDQKRWPEPNEHGVYPEKQAERFSFPHKGVDAEILVLQIGPRDWISQGNYSYSVGNMEGTAAGLSARYVFETRLEALKTAALNICTCHRELLKRPSSLAVEQKRLVRKVLEWAEQFGRGERGAVAELNLEIETTAAPEPQEERVRLATEQLIKDVLALKSLIEDRGKRIIPLKTLKSVFHLSLALTQIKKFRDSLLQSEKAKATKQVEAAQRRELLDKRKAVARSAWVKGLRKTSPAAKEFRPGDRYVLCRVNQSGKPTFRTRNAGWTDNPQNAMTFTSSSAAAAESHHSYDRPARLKRAEVLAKKWKGAGR